MANSQKIFASWPRLEAALRSTWRWLGGLADWPKPLGGCFPHGDAPVGRRVAVAALEAEAAQPRVRVRVGVRVRARARVRARVSVSRLTRRLGLELELGLELARGMG